MNQRKTLAFNPVEAYHARMKIQNPIYQLINPALITAVLMIISACGAGKEQRPAAPLGEKAALETLAKAYNDVAGMMQTTPSLLPPEARKQFVEQVFNQAGYDYSLTLMLLSGEQMDPGVQFHRDLAELVLLPQKGLSYDDFATIYNEKEVIAVQTLLAKLRRKNKSSQASN